MQIKNQGKVWISNDPNHAISEHNDTVRQSGWLEEISSKNKGIAIFSDFFYNFFIE
jgi:hypothetical protein